MKYYTTQDLEVAFRSLGVHSGDIVLVQTALMDLGINRDCALSDIPRAIYCAIRRQIGTEGTVCAQAFTFSSMRGIVYDPQEPNMITGAFTRYLHGLDGTLRSPHPFQSLVANGPAAFEICSGDTLSGYDKKGAYGCLLKLNARLLLIGRYNVDTGSLAHYAEEQAAVPYREWKQFDVAYRKDFKTENRNYSMYVRRMDYNAQIDLSHLCAEMETKNIFRSIPVGNSDVRIAQCRDVFNFLMERLSNDPWIMVKNKPLEKDYMKDGSNNVRTNCRSDQKYSAGSDGKDNRDNGAG